MDTEKDEKNIFYFLIKRKRPASNIIIIKTKIR